MAVNLIDSTDIKITQEDSDIKLEFTTNAVANKNIYSTTEQRIGTWTDGKPLYRKVIETTTPNDTSVGVIGTLSNVNKVINLYGMLSYGSQQVPLTLAYSTTVLNAILIEGNNINCKVSAGAYTNCPCYVVLEYTKTTD